MYEDFSEETIVICKQCNKRCYSRRKAGELVNRNGRSFRRDGHYRKSHKKIPIRYYWCSYSRSYHLTSKKGGMKND